MGSEWRLRWHCWDEVLCRRDTRMAVIKAPINGHFCHNTFSPPEAFLATNGAWFTHEAQTYHARFRLKPILQSTHLLILACLTQTGGWWHQNQNVLKAGLVWAVLDSGTAQAVSVRYPQIVSFMCWLRWLCWVSLCADSADVLIVYFMCWSKSAREICSHPMRMNLHSNKNNS